MKHLIRVPLPKLAGAYGAHERVYAANDGGRPVWRRFSDHAIVLADKPSTEFPCKEYDPSPKKGMSVLATLLFNIAVERGEPGKTKRIDPVLTEWIARGKKGGWRELGYEIGRQWLIERQETHGYQILRSEQIDYGTIEFMKSGKPIRIGTIDFRGILEVTDAERFKAAMLNGIGHGKAWGCGLLLCKRVNQGD